MTRPDDIPEDVRRAAIEAADEYRANTGDGAFNLNFDGTMRLLSIAILAERERCAKVAEDHAATARKIYDSNPDDSIAPFVHAQSLAFATDATAIRRGQQ